MELTMRTPIALLLLAVLAPAPGALAQQVQASDVVVTSGEGLIQAAPDRAWITIGAETRGPSAREAQRRNVEAMRPVQEALRKAGIPADAVRTVGYDLQQEFDFVNNKRVSRGYVARNSLEVRVDDVNRLGELLELSVGQGATTVHGLRFDVKDRAKLEREALQQAIADARAKAEAAAAAAGRGVDRVIRIEEGGGPVSPPMPMFRTQAALRQGGDEVPIATGQIEIRALATVTTLLK
jgi:uncharacterized protein YggE